MLCTKALRALFDVIQGQIPESFKAEPNELIQPLYDMLLELATLHGPAAQSNDASNWSAIGCSALLGLCVARGDTGKTLKAISALLMSPKVLATQNIQVYPGIHSRLAFRIVYKNLYSFSYHWYCRHCNAVFTQWHWASQRSPISTKMAFHAIRRSSNSR